MKAIIPAKCNSSRLPNKNWRKFYDGKSLVEVKIAQLVGAGMNPSDIYVFCEDESKRNKAEQLGATFVVRDEATTKDDMHWSDVVSTLVSSLEFDDYEPIAWVQATTPLFSSVEFSKVFECWSKIQDNKDNASSKWNGYDCITTVRPVQEFILNSKGRPINYNFGRWHEWSQDLEPLFYSACTIHIMLKKDYLRHNYHIGTKPYLYGSYPNQFNNISIDIDTLEDFNLARMLHQYYG